MSRKQKLKSRSRFNLNFDPSVSVTAFAGLVFLERVASRLGLWTRLGKALPKRLGKYSWGEIMKSVTLGLATGSTGTYAAEELREDQAALNLLGMREAPEEVTVWRSLEGVGEEAMGEVLDDHLLWAAHRVLSRAPRKRLLLEGFFPVFMDGSLLEGSTRREGTKFWKDKGSGLLLSTVFAGPVCAAGRLAGEGEGESSCVRAMVPEVLRRVVAPLKLPALVLADSLHGDGPTCDLLESENAKYVIGAQKLDKTEEILADQPEEVWFPTPEYDENRNVEESAVCVCKIQCEAWDQPRILVGRRYRPEGQLFFRYAGVLTNLTPDDLSSMQKKKKKGYAECVWRLYDKKQGCENHYKDLLTHLDLHHPPCTELQRNRGFYALGMLAALLLRSLDLLGGEKTQRAHRRFRTLQRRLLALPGRIAVHARTATVTLLGLGPRLTAECQGIWSRLCRC